MHKLNKVLILHPLNRTAGLWCNGNTTVFGAVFLGSSPSRPTEKPLRNERLFLLCTFKIKACCIRVLIFSCFGFYLWFKDDGTIPNFFLNEKEKCERSSKPTPIYTSDGRFPWLIK